ncbi:hypothetical protein I4U23_027088 [Adineta vaga]|nr:hypothetical protein I4U23_027088 [Adineta vaga]
MYYSRHRLCMILNPSVLTAFKRQYSSNGVIQRSVLPMILLNKTIDNHKRIQMLNHHDMSDDEREMKRKNSLLETHYKRALDNFSINNVNDHIIIESYDKLLDTFDQNINPQLLGHFHVLLGHCHRDKGMSPLDHARALYHYDCALTRYENHMEFYMIMEAYSSSAYALAIMEKYQESIERITKAIHVIETLNGKIPETNNRIIDRARGKKFSRGGAKGRRGG